MPGLPPAVVIKKVVGWTWWYNYKICSQVSSCKTSAAIMSCPSVRYLNQNDRDFNRSHDVKDDHGVLDRNSCRLVDQFRRYYILLTILDIWEVCKIPLFSAHFIGNTNTYSPHIRDKIWKFILGKSFDLLEAKTEISAVLIITTQHRIDNIILILISIYLFTAGIHELILAK